MSKKLMSVFGVQGDEAPVPSAPVTQPSPSEVSTPAPRSLMTLGKTLFFKGELAADEDLLLLGRVEGSIHHTENLTIGIGGIVKGDLRARTITVKGTVEGDMEASESVTVAPTANVLGDIAAPRVSIIEGAKFNGNVKMLAPAIETRLAAAASSELAEPLDPAAEQALLGH